MIQIKRIYEKYNKTDGARVLVDRLWPRGISKEDAKINLWLKEIAPSDELRSWFAHDSQKWNEFQKRYKKELELKKEFITQLKKLEDKHKTITLLYGAKDEEHNQAIILAEMINHTS